MTVTQSKIDSMNAHVSRTNPVTINFTLTPEFIVNSIHDDNGGRHTGPLGDGFIGGCGGFD